MEDKNEFEVELRAFLEDMESRFPAAILRKSPGWLRVKKFLQKIDNEKSVGIGYIK
jgi:hypothetical protein